MARVLNHPHTRHMAFGVACVAVAVIFFIIGALLRVLVGPVSLGPLKGEISDSLNTTLPGVQVRFDDAALEWSRDEGRINIAVLGARVYDSDGRIIAQAPKAEVDLAAAPFLRGKVKVKRVALLGMQLALVRTKEGSLRIGVEKDKTGADLLRKLQDAISSGSNQATSLESLAIRKARIAFFDEGTGLFVVAPEANLTLTTAQGAGAVGRVQLGIDAKMEVSGKPATITGNILVPSGNEPLSGDVSMHGLDLHALGENSKFFASLLPFHLTSDLSGSFRLKGTSLRYADFSLGANGTVTGLGQPVHVKAFRLVGRYDGETGRLLVDDSTLEGDQIKAHMTGQGDLSFDQQGVVSKIALSLGLDKVTLDMPSELGEKVSLSGVDLRADYVPSPGVITIRRAAVNAGPLAVQASGTLTLAGSQTPAIDVQGRMNAITVRDLLKYWPLNVAKGARDWIAPNITDGSVGPVVFQTKIPAGALSQDALPEDALTVTFPITDATVIFVKGMDPLTRTEGTAKLTGDTFSADVVSAQIGPLKVAQGVVTIPDLHVVGTTGEIKGHVEGSVTDVLHLIDEKPLQYPTRFHIDPVTTTGQSAIDLDFKVPMLKDLSVDDIGIDIKTQLTDFAIKLNEEMQISNGTLAMDVDGKHLHAAGDVNIGAARLNVDWTEMFGDADPMTTRIIAKGTLDAAGRSALNFHANEFLEGPVNATAQLVGHRGTIRKATMTMDLTPAAVTFDLVNYKKAAGVAATANASATFADDGAIASETLALSGAGLDAQGTVKFDKLGQIAKVDFPSVRAGPNNDFAFHLSDDPTGYVASLTGRSIDGGGIGRRSATDESSSEKKPVQPQQPEAPETNVPFKLSAHVQRLVMREGVVMAPFDFDASGLGHRPNAVSLNGSFGKTGKVTGTMTRTPAGREINVTSNDAGLLARGLFGFASMKNGSLKINVKFPTMTGGMAQPDGRTPDYTGEVDVNDFTIVNQPFLTRLFSAGSLVGLIDLMRGQGITIDKLEAPFSARNNVITIHDARASGPSVGVTADGYIDRPRNQIALKGTMAPIYGLNSVLGAIPLVGDVLVSKKGEGVFGMTYSVTGDADKPEISVNPLSVLAPGILRRIFEGSIPVDPNQQAPAKKPDNQKPVPAPPAATQPATPPPTKKAAPKKPPVTVKPLPNKTLQQQPQQGASQPPPKTGPKG